LRVALTQPIRIDDAVVVEGSGAGRRKLHPWGRAPAHSEIIGTVLVYADYTLPVDPVREQLQRILKDSPLSNGQTCVLQETDFTETTMQRRSLMSATLRRRFDLRCMVRDGMIGFLQKQYPRSLPTRREAVGWSSKPPAEPLPRP
jgi:hypothetical protein